MPNRARPGAAPAKARLQRSAQRSDSFMARAISARSAGSRTHSSSCMTMSEPSRFCTSIARSGESSTMAPSRCERNVTPRLGDAAQRRKRHHLKAAGIGQDRIRPAHEGMQPAERRDALGRRPQHQMIGVAEENVGARGAHVVAVHALTAACVPTGMNAGVRTTPCAVAISPVRAAPSVARRRKEKRVGHGGAQALHGTAGRRRRRNRTDSPFRSRAHRRAASPRARRRRRPA